MRVHPTRPNLSTSVLKWKRVSGIRQVNRRLTSLASAATPENRVACLLKISSVILSLAAGNRGRRNSVWLTQGAVTTPRDRPSEDSYATLARQFRAAVIHHHFYFSLGQIILVAGGGSLANWRRSRRPTQRRRRRSEPDNCPTSARSASSGIDGHKLLLIGLLFCVFGLVFGLAIYMQLKNLPCIARCAKSRS